MKNMKWIFIAICTQTAFAAPQEYDLLTEGDRTEETFKVEYKVSCPGSTTLTASSKDMQLTLQGGVSSSGMYGNDQSITLEPLDGPTLSARVTVKYLHGLDHFSAPERLKFKCNKSDAVVENLGQRRSS